MSNFDHASQSPRPLHLLFEVVHPADVLFFARPIRACIDAGDRVTVASREKDVATTLLDELGIAHTPISRQRNGVLGLASELLTREVALLKLARRDRPDVMIGFGAVAISHVGKLLGIPTLSIYDSDNAGLQTRLAWPFVTRLLVPQAYDGPVPEGRTRRLSGTKDLSYFHPSAFRPDHSKALALGLDPERPNVFIRVVRWGANHDLGKSGWSDAQAQTLVAALAPRAKLHVCAEAEVPPALAPHLWQGDPGEVHHLLGNCDAYVGESCTMACEALTMGVPALYSGVDFPGYTRDLARRGLLQLLQPEDRDHLAEAAVALLDRSDAFAERHATWIADCPDWSDAVVDNIRELAT